MYCRPSCAARRADPRNVSFHTSSAEAERAGFRACRRCRPEQTSPQQPVLDAVARACRAIERAATTPPLAVLARTAGLSPHHFHRVFKKTTGVTPGQYAAGVRSRRLATGLLRGRGVTDAIYGAGYGSGSRVYERSAQLLGMTPGQYRAGAPDVPITFTTGTSTLGGVLVARTATGVCAILLGDTPEALEADLRRRFPRAAVARGTAALARLLQRVVTVIERPGTPPELPLDIRGTVFQVRVWDALRRIPAGATASYAEVARAIGAPSSARAVAAACGANPLAVVVPCHRVVRGDGSLSGYRWGLDRKRALLQREGGIPDPHPRPGSSSRS